MRRFGTLGLAVFVLGCAAAGTALAQTRSETDGCLVALYNYPAETPRRDAAAEAPPESLPSRVRSATGQQKTKNPPPRRGAFALR